MSRRIVRKILVNLGIALPLWEITERVIPPGPWQTAVWALAFAPTYVVVHMWLDAEPETKAIARNRAGNGPESHATAPEGVGAGVETHRRSKHGKGGN